MEGTEHSKERYEEEEYGESNEEMSEGEEEGEEYVSDEEEEEELPDLPKACELQTGDKDVRLRLDGFAYMPLNPYAPSQPRSPVMRYTWRTRNRMTVQLINYGSTITCIKVPNSKGYVHDVIMGFDNLESYMDRKNPYFGATIGRVANIISEATYTHRKQKIDLKVNKPPHHINGGKRGFDKELWEHHNEGAKVIMSHYSKSHTEGYPGNLIVNISYEVTSSNKLIIEMTASCDSVTPVNLTNDLYFNLAGHGAGPYANYQHVITVNAEKYTPLNEKMVPNGNIRHVGGTPFDLRVPRGLGIMIEKTPTKGFNHNLCIKSVADQKMVFVARVLHPENGRIMEIYSDQPGLQLYTADSLPDTSKALAQMQASSSYNSEESEGTKRDSKGRKTREKGNMTSVSQTGGTAGTAGAAAGAGTADGTGTKAIGTDATAADQGTETADGLSGLGKKVLKADKDAHHGADTEFGGRKGGGPGATKVSSKFSGGMLPPLPHGVPCTTTCPCAMTDEERRKLLEKYKTTEDEWAEGGGKKAGETGEGEEGEGADGKLGKGAAGAEGEGGKGKGKGKGEGQEDEEAKRKAAESGKEIDARKQWTDDWGDDSDISDSSLLRYGSARGMASSLFSPEGMKGKAGAVYCKHGAFVMQTQAYPDAPNKKNFPVIWLHPEESYKHRIIYKFGIRYKPDEVPGVLQPIKMEDEATLTSSFSDPENVLIMC